MAANLPCEAGDQVVKQDGFQSQERERFLQTRNHKGWGQGEEMAR